MKTKNPGSQAFIRSSRPVVLAALAFLLAGCGGGGGGGTSAPIAASSPGTSSPGSGTPGGTSGATSGVALQTSVPVATYAAGTAQAYAFQSLNSYRLAMGVGELAQDPVLDTSASAHTTYLFANLVSGAIPALTHDEIAGYVDYYADTPLARADKAGAPASEWIGEVIGDGAPQASQQGAGQDCVNGLLDTVYHQVSMTSTQQTVGLGFSTNANAIYICTADFGASAGVPASPGANELPYSGGQQLPTNVVVHSPLNGETGVLTAMRAEAPNPASDLSAPGHPVLVRVNAQNADILTVSQFTLTDSSGATVPARILVPQGVQPGSSATTVTDPNNALPEGTAVLLPLAALNPNTTYNVTFTGARDAVPVNTAWSFTTGAQ
jgi:uncharacterized protein YkwD